MCYQSLVWMLFSCLLSETDKNAQAIPAQVMSKCGMITVHHMTKKYLKLTPGITIVADRLVGINARMLMTSTCQLNSLQFNLTHDFNTCQLKTTDHPQYKYVH